jgi:hypothetical protein
MSDQAQAAFQCCHSTLTLLLTVYHVASLAYYYITALAVVRSSTLFDKAYIMLYCIQYSSYLTHTFNIATSVATVDAHSVLLIHSLIKCQKKQFR